jgi:hypothetical protein
MNRILLLIILAYSAPCFSQTCILVRRERNKIIAVADSKVQIQIGKEKLDSNRQKIGGYGKIYFGVSGTFFDESYNLAMECCILKTSFKIIIDSFLSKQTIQLAKLFDSLKVSNDSQYSYYLHNNFNSSFIVFFYYEKKEFKIVVFQISVYESSSGRCGTMIFRNPPLKMCQSEKVFYLGHVEGIKDSICIEKIWQKNPFKTAVYLIGKQIENTPDEVGAPIDYIIFKKRGGKIKRIN